MASAGVASSADANAATTTEFFTPISEIFHDPVLIAGPAVEPVSLAEMRAYLRLDDGAEDDLVRRSSRRRGSSSKRLAAGSSSSRPGVSSSIGGRSAARCCCPYRH